MTILHNHLDHMMNTAQRQVTAHPQTQPTHLRPEFAIYYVPRIIFGVCPF